MLAGCRFGEAGREETCMTLAARLHKIENGLLVAERVLLTLLVVGMTTLGFVQIVLRKVFEGGFLWADTFLRHLVLWVAFLGAGAAVAQNKHFGADLGERLFTGRTRLVTQLVVQVLTVGVCALLAWASLIFINDEFKSAQSHVTLGPLHLPSSWFEIILPIGFVLLFMHYVIKSLETALEIRK
jgi:TRAP-type C4-dicarboxylate transport system permease small subunit